MNSFDQMFIGHTQLTVLAIVDVIIVYLFCTLQLSYNFLTARYIIKSQARVNRIELWRAYLFAMAPIVYSLLPILLVLYFYNPNYPNTPEYTHLPGREFALTLVWIHLPPIVLVFSMIIVWNIICTLHNKKIDSFKILASQNHILTCQDNKVAGFDAHSKVVFRIAIYKWYQQMIKKIENVDNNDDLLKLMGKLEGWYIAKQRFQFFWCTKKAYAFIKDYYHTHYEGLRFYCLEAYERINCTSAN